MTTCPYGKCDGSGFYRMWIAEDETEETPCECEMKKQELKEELKADDEHKEN